MKKFHLLIATALLLPAAPALAQETPSPAAAQSDDEDPAVVTGARRRTDIIVTASGIEQYPEDVGRSVTLIERGDIERSQALSLSDLLATTPGVTVSRNGGIGGFTGVRIRGAEGEQTLVLIDGVRVNDPSSPSGGFDFGNLLTGAISRVEVLRGPNSVVWGGQAIGGVVNVVTDGPQGYWGVQARGNAEYGYADTASANGAVILGGDGYSGSVTAGYFRTDGISAAANGTEADGYRQYGATARLKVDIVENVAVDVRGYFADSRTDLDGFPPPLYGFTDTDEYSTARELYGYAGLTADLFDDSFHSRLAFTAADIDRDNFDPAAGTAPVFFGRGSSERYEYLGNVEAAEWVRVVFGAEHEDSRFTDGSTIASTGISSGYGQLILKPADELVTINAGVRHDDHRDFGGHTSFGLSGAFHPGDDTTLRASYGEGFKAPTLYQLYSFFGDPTLQPENARSYEVGAEQRFAYGDFRIGAALFRRDTTNQIDFDLGTFTYGNIARTRASGVELTMFARPEEHLTINASYTHVRAENRSPGANLGNDLARRPRDIGNLSVDYRFYDGPTLGATLLVAGGSFDDAGNFNRLDGYALVGVRAEMPIGDHFVVYGRVDNLFDEQYQTVAGYGTLGRAAYLGVRLKLD